MKKSNDLAIVQQVLAAMSLTQRREWFIKFRMSARHKSFREIAHRHKFSTWLLASAVQGKANWSPRIIKALQDDLDLDLSPFLTEKEAAKLACK